MARRNEAAKAAAERFAEDLEAGRLDPAAEDFNQASPGVGRVGGVGSCAHSVTSEIEGGASPVQL